MESAIAGNDVILGKFRAALDHVFGARIVRVVLYGSRARGDAEPDSDYDLAVFLSDYSDYWTEAAKLDQIQLTLLDETGAVIHAEPFPAAGWNAPSTLMAEVRRYGVDL